MSKVLKIAAISLVVLGVLMAVLAFWSGTGRSKPIEMPRAESVQERLLFPAVHASRDLPAGHLITLEDVTVERLERMPSGAFAAPHLVQGRTLAEAVAQGALITERGLVEGLAGLLTEGERAVSIKVDEGMAVGHKLKPGDWVDVFVVLNRAGQVGDTAQARLLLPQKKILAYGEKLLLTPVTGEDGKTQEPSKQVARTAVLAVPVEEVNRLLLAEQQGQLQLALRSPLDKHQPSADILKQIPGMGGALQVADDANRATVALDSSLAALKAADLALDVKQAGVKPAVLKGERSRPRAADAPGNVVEIIRGTQRETQRY